MLRFFIGICYDQYTRCVVEMADAGEIFLDKPTAMLVTDYPKRIINIGGSGEPPIVFN